MKRLTKEEKIISIVGTIIFLLYIAFDFYRSEKEINKIFDYLDKNYPHISIEDSIKNKIVFIYKIPSDLPVTGQLCVQDVELDDGRKVELRIDRELSGEYLGEILTVGDSVIKYPGSDTLIIKKANKQYRFIILKD